MAAAVSAAPVKGPANTLDFCAQLRNNPNAWEKVMRIGRLAISTFAKSKVTGALGTTYRTLDFGIKTINVIQFINPVAYFVNGKFLDREKSPANTVFFGAHLYISFCDASEWIKENTAEIASVIRGLGTTYPLVGRVVSANIAKFVLPAALVMFAANAYIAGDKLVKALQTGDVKERNKASLQLAWSVGQIALTSFAMVNVVNPYLLGGIVAAEFATHAIGLVGDGYGVYNP